MRSKTNKVALILALSLFYLHPIFAQDIRGGILDKNVNSDDEDYAAYVIYGNETDTLFFTSSRYVENRRPIALSAEIFYSTRPSSFRYSQKPINEGWSKAERIKTEASRIAEFTRGSQSIRDDRIIFAAERDLSTTTAAGTSYLFDLWEMIKGSQGFSTPSTLAEVNELDAWDSQPALSVDGKTLYFVSNRQGGKGGLDIWYSFRDYEGKWTKPHPVPNINTPGDEISPHCGYDGKFYFSSNWNYEKNEKGSRGKDIYRCDYQLIGGMEMPGNPLLLDKAFEIDAKNYGVQIPADIDYNSDYDDEFPFISPDRQAIFITSNRKGAFSKRNIYAFSMPKSKIMLLVNVKEQIFDTGNNLIVPPTEKRGLPLTLVDKDTGSTMDIRSGEKIEIEADKIYHIRFTKFVEEECYQNKIEGPAELTVETKKPFGPDTLYIRDVLVSRKKIDIEPIIFHSTDTLPYFITGYWFPNTSENIKNFRLREAAGFFDATGFIDSTGHDYENISHIIDDIFNSRIYTPLIKLLPLFQEFCRDTLYLKVTIHGYTDPRGLSAGNEHPYRPQSRYKRIYPDETVTVGVDEKGQPVTIERGFDMFKKSWPKDPNNKSSQWISLADEGQEGNILLSKLRSYYTFVTFDNAMRHKSPIYAQLRDNGRVLLDAEGFGIDKAGYEQRQLKDDPSSRRIEIYLDILRPEELAYHKRLQGGNLLVVKPDIKISNQIPVEEKKADSLEITTFKEAGETQSSDNPPIKTSTKTDIPTLAEVSVNNTPLPPPEEKPVQPQVTEEQCYVIQYNTYDNKEEADNAKKILNDNGITDARIDVYFDPFGNQGFRVRSGCYNTASEAINELNNLEKVARLLHLKKKPMIVK